MRIFWKYFFGFLTLGILIIFYFLKTDLGHQNLGYFIENYLSKQTYNKIEVYSLNLEKYPYLTIELQVNETAKVTLKGEVSKYSINMYYHLVGDSFRFNNFLLENKVDVQGKLSGPFSSLHVKGYGKIFGGEVKYDFINTSKEIKAMSIEMKKVDSEKILTFLEQKALLKGSTDIDAQFNLFSKYDKQGKVKIYMHKAFISQISEDIPFVWNSTIEFENMDYKYKGDIRSDIGTVILNNGYYDRSKKVDNGNYEIHVKDLAYFEKILKGKYQGTLDLNGSLMYDNYNGLLVIKGHTAEFGGDLSYIYKKNNIDFKLKAVSLGRLLKKFSYPVFFSSDIYGTISFDIKEEILIINTKLKNTRFKDTKLSDIIDSKLKTDLLAGVYNKSCFLAGYQNSVFSSTLKIDNGKNHIYLTDTKMNTLNNSIDSKLEMKLEEQEIYGEIYGTLEDPKVWIDKSKFFKHETKRRVGSWLGTTE